MSKGTAKNKQQRDDKNVTPAFQKYTDSNGVERIAKNKRNLEIGLSVLGFSPRFNAFSGRVCIDGLEGGVFTDKRQDAARRHVRLRLEDIGLKMQASRFNELFDEIADENSFNPLIDYLDGLTWDGEPRVDDWLITYLGAEPTPLNQAIGRIVLTAAVRRAKFPGTKFDTALVLEGVQGSLKSSAIAALAPSPEMFTDNVTVSMDTKTMVEQTQGVWLAELSELSGMSKSEVEHIKHMLSKTEDTCRLAYERYRSEHPRQFIFIGTTNGDNYLRDDTGNRRFLPVRTREIHLDTILRDRDQLWAEAVVLEGAGEEITLPRDMWETAAIEQEMRREENPFLEAIASEIKDNRFTKTELTTGEVYEMLNIDVEKRTTGNARIIADAMKRLGCSAKRKSVREGHKVTSITLYVLPETML